MLLYSKQYRYIKSYVLSFKNNKIFYTKITDNELQRYKKIYNPEKFETFSESDFKLLIILLLLKKDYSINSLMIYLNEAPLVELKKLLNKRDDILTYKNVIKEDINIIKQYNKDLKIIIKLYKENKITEFGMYWFMYFNQDQISTRIQNKLWKKLSIFLSFFTIIKEHIESIERD